jgi:LysR family nitrogen assimilation transcriptional regulator
VVGMPAALRHLVTLPALQMMRSKSPGTAIRVHEGFNVFLRDMLKHGLLDMAVIAMEQIPEASIVPEMLVCEPLVLVRNAKLSPPHDPVRIEDVVEFPLALPGRPNAVRGIVDRANVSLPKFRSNPRTPDFVWSSSATDWSDRR